MERKKRSDRNHVIYLIQNTVTSESYIGLTVCRGQAKLKSAKDRWVQHTYNAFRRGLNGNLYQNIRTYGEDAFKVTVLDIARGKPHAHTLETKWIETLKPQLNMLKTKV